MLTKWKLAQKIEYRWWKKYLEKRDVTEYLKWKYNYWHVLLQSIYAFVDPPHGKTILDAGCGPAGIFMNLEGNTVHAMDPLLEKYKSFKHFLPERYPWTQFINSPLEDLNEVATYDLIFCMNAINHVNHIDLCYDKMVKALKPGGYLIISTDCHRNNFVKKIFQLIPGDVLHPIQLNILEYHEFLTKRNMKILSDVIYKQELIFNYHLSISQKAS